MLTVHSALLTHAHLIRLRESGKETLAPQQIRLSRMISIIFVALYVFLFRPLLHRTLRIIAQNI